MDVVTTINSAVDPTYAANKGCKRICLRLRSRNQRVQHVALQLLETCMRSCGEPFHNELSKSDLFNNELARMADRSIWCSTDIQRLVLARIQEWAYEIKIPAYSALFNRLKQRGLPFGPRGQTADQLFQPYPGLSPPSPGSAGGSAGVIPPSSPSQAMQNPHIGRPRSQRPHGTGGAGEGGSRPSSRGGANIGADLLRPGRTQAELLSDLATARESVTLLNDVLDGAEKEANWGAVKEEYCGEVAGACEAIIQRLAALLGSGISDETLVAQALEVNDDAQKALDKRNRLLEVAEGRRSPPMTPSRAIVENGNGNGARRVEAHPVSNLESPTATAAPAAAAAAAVAAAPARQDPGNLMDLLDLDWTPAPETEAMKHSDPFLPPPPMVPPPRNNPFAAAPASGEAYNPPPVTVERLPVGPNANASTAISSAGPSANATPAASVASAAAESNPFMNDDAFAQLSIGSTGGPAPAGRESTSKPSSLPSSPLRPPHGSVPGSIAIATTGPALSSKPSGNPFAAGFDAAGPSTSAPPPSTGPSFNRPPPLSIPGTGPDSQINSGYIPTPGPYTAPPAYPGAPSPAYAPQYGGQYGQGPLPTASSIGSMQYHGNPQQYHSNPPSQQYPQIYPQGSWGGGQPQQGGYQPAAVQQQQQNNPYLSVPPSFGAPGGMTNVSSGGYQGGVYGSAPMQNYGGGIMMPLSARQQAGSDSFKDLVVLKPKKEDLPPPPKGEPMRRGGSASSSTPSASGGQQSTVFGNGGGRVSPPAAPPVPVQQEPTAAAGGHAAWSAFDAFDTIGK